MHIVVLGAKGLQGSELARAFSARHEVTAWDIEDLDVTDHRACLDRLSALRPDLIAHSVAWVSFDGNELEPDRAWRVNALSAQNVTLSAQRLDCEMLYISSAAVFDGIPPGEYDETSVPRPISQYGRTKVMGEWFTMHLCRRFYVLRTAWLIGRHPNSYDRKILAQADKNGVVRYPEDQIESLTYAKHVAEAAAALVTLHAYGLYHAASKGTCTRVEMARELLRLLGRKEPVEAVERSAVGSVARRPYKVELKSRLIELVTGYQFPHWKEALQEYLVDTEQIPAAGAR
jgi:dTDP-4-dehydrorhamnose reductase